MIRINKQSTVLLVVFPVCAKLWEFWCKKTKILIFYNCIRFVEFCNVDWKMPEITEMLLSEWAHFLSLTANIQSFTLYFYYQFIWAPQQYSVLTLNVEVSVSFCDISCWIASTFCELFAVLSVVNCSNLQWQFTTEQL